MSSLCAGFIKCTVVGMVITEMFYVQDGVPNNCKSAVMFGVDQTKCCGLCRLQMNMAGTAALLFLHKNYHAKLFNFNAGNRTFGWPCFSWVILGHMFAIAVFAFVLVSFTASGISGYIA